MCMNINAVRGSFRLRWMIVKNKDAKKQISPNKLNKNKAYSKGGGELQINHSEILLEILKNIFLSIFLFIKGGLFFLLCNKGVIFM